MYSYPQDSCTAVSYEGTLSRVALARMDPVAHAVLLARRVGCRNLPL